MEPVFLRELERNDIENTYKWHNDRLLFKTLDLPFRYTSFYNENEELPQRVKFSNQEVKLAICMQDSGMHIGNTYLRNINWTARNGEVSLFIGEDDANKKIYEKSAVRLLIKYAFNDLCLFRLYTYVLEKNRPKIDMFQQTGWEIEAIMINHIFKNGEYRNVVVLGFCVNDLTQEIDSYMYEKEESSV